MRNCEHCRGAGKVAGLDCSRCDGAGQVAAARAWCGYPYCAARKPVDGLFAPPPREDR